MKKMFLKTKVIASFLFVFVCFSGYSQDLQNLRYFMQDSSSTVSAIPYGNNPSAGHYVKSGDAKIYYEVYGTGSPVVVLHGGIVGSTLEMGRFIDSLSQNYRVIAISTRGHGKSEIGTVVPGYEQKAKDVNTVLETESKEKAIVLGFSDGAYTGYFFAKEYPHKIDRLVAIGAGEWERGDRNFSMNSKSAFAMDERYWEQQMMIRPQPERIDEWFNSLNKYYNNLEISENVFAEVRCPVLVLAGENDQNAPLNTVLSAYRMLPNSQLSIIPNAPHPVFQVNFPAVWESITPFLNQKISN